MHHSWNKLLVLQTCKNCMLNWPLKIPVRWSLKGQKWSQKGPKCWPKWNQKGAKWWPEWYTNRFKTILGPQIGSSLEKFNFLMISGCIFGLPQGPLWCLNRSKFDGKAITTSVRKMMLEKLRILLVSLPKSMPKLVQKWNKNVD